MTIGKNIDIHSLGEGVYFYQITTEEQQAAGKFIKLATL
ncbi:MAG: T9SS type A sorting domain-containing protein [Saprospiraceae bacterium]